MDVLKYFYEEPVDLEVLTPDADPDARRRAGPSLPLETFFAAPGYALGYLAGTDLAAGRVGLTAIAHPEAFVAPLLDWLSGGYWTHADAAGTVTALAAEEAGRVLAEPGGTRVLAWAAAPAARERLLAAGRAERRAALPALRRLLQVARAVFFPEPAHHGFDWSFFTAQPARADLIAALRRHPYPDVRRFALPYQKARSEEKFYFEAYDLEGYAGFEIA